MIFKISTTEELHVLFDSPRLKRSAWMLPKIAGIIYVPFVVIKIFRGDKDKLIYNRSVYDPRMMTPEQKNKVIGYCEKLARKHCKERGKTLAPLDPHPANINHDDVSRVADSRLGHATHHRGGTWSYFGYRNKK